ncbi:MAG: hypothetical protein LUQ32_03475 [Methanomicrobiales archaeon]|nr:hypothetical protein [Methanomicrobiales archaeon]
MEGLNAEGQWIVMMGFLVSLGIFFLAIVISQSTLVGQTTAEGVLEFPKNDIQDLKHDILEIVNFERTSCPGGCPAIMSNISREIQQISLYRKSAIVNYTLKSGVCTKDIVIHYDNGVTVYDEKTTIFFSC